MPDQLRDVAYRDRPRRWVQPTPFEVIHRVSPTGPQELDVHGELDAATVPELRAKLSATREGARPVVVDLRACDFIDSAGMRLIVQTQRSAATIGEAPRVVVIARGRIAELFALAGVDSEGAIVSSWPEAVRAVAAPWMGTRPAHAEPEVAA